MLEHRDYEMLDSTTAKTIHKVLLTAANAGPSLVRIDFILKIHVFHNRIRKTEQERQHSDRNNEEGNTNQIQRRTQDFTIRRGGRG